MKNSMCISSNWVNQAQDLMAVKKIDDLQNKLIPADKLAKMRTKFHVIIQVKLIMSLCYGASLCNVAVGCAAESPVCLRNCPCLCLPPLATQFNYTSRQLDTF